MRLDTLKHQHLCLCREKVLFLGPHTVGLMLTLESKRFLGEDHGFGGTKKEKKRLCKHFNRVFLITRARNQPSTGNQVDSVKNDVSALGETDIEKVTPKRS